MRKNYFPGVCYTVSAGLLTACVYISHSVTIAFAALAVGCIALDSLRKAR